MLELTVNLLVLAVDRLSLSNICSFNSLTYWFLVKLCFGSWAGSGDVLNRYISVISLLEQHGGKVDIRSSCNVPVLLAVQLSR